MAYKDRVGGQNLQLFSLESTDYLLSIRRCMIRREIEVQENKALLDNVRYNEPTVRNWLIEFTMAIDEVYRSTVALLNKVGTSISLTVDIGPFTYSCSRALLLSDDHDVPDDLQEITFTIVPQGIDLTIANS
jgi:hypothetical protein